MESQNNNTSVSRSEQCVALALCIAVLLARAVEQLAGNQPDYAGNFAPYWIPLVASIFAAMGILRLNGHPGWLRIQGVLQWSGLLLMVWTANGLLFDLLRITGLIPFDVDWPGVVTRTFALGATFVLARIALNRPAAGTSRPATWYGYAAFLLALPYPVLRICWALGGTIGITYAGAAGKGFAPLLIAIPWALAACVSLFLVSKPSWMPRKLLLTAGWTATAIVATIGPGAFWAVIKKLIEDGDYTTQHISTWVFCLFYGSWFLWAIAAGAATRSYQLRTSGRPYS